MLIIMLSCLKMTILEGIINSILIIISQYKKKEDVLCLKYINAFKRGFMGTPLEPVFPLITMRMFPTLMLWDSAILMQV